GVLNAGPYDDQRLWSRNASNLLGLSGNEPSPHDYISTLIAWDRRTVVSMCTHIERLRGRHWIAAIASTRQFSECMIYGRSVDGVLDGAGHWHDSTEFCRVHWTGEPMDDEAFAAFIEAMEPAQLAIGMQSFIGTDIARIRRLAMSA